MLAVMVMTLSGCCKAAKGTAECTHQVRDVTWSTPAGQTQRRIRADSGKLSRTGAATTAPNASGLNFADVQEHVTFWSVDGYSPDEVLGVRLEEVSYAFHVLGIRKVLCSTNAIVSLNARYRRGVITEGHFPTEQAALKTRYLVTRMLNPKAPDRHGGSPGWKPGWTPSPLRSPTACWLRKAVMRIAVYTVRRTGPIEMRRLTVPFELASARRCRLVADS